MGHQCTKCGELYPDAAPELLAGCKCGSKFFYYIRQERLDELNRINNQEIQETISELNKADKDQIEKDIREITGLDEEPDKPVILNIESVRVLKPGKFEIDIINLFSKKRPLIYKLEEGKYIIDLSSSLKVDMTEVDKKIKNPEVELEAEKEEKDSEEDSKKKKKDKKDKKKNKVDDKNQDEEKDETEEDSEEKEYSTKKTPSKKGKKAGDKDEEESEESEKEKEDEEINENEIKEKEE